MIRLALRLLPWALCAAAALLILIGFVGLVGKTEETPTNVTAKALTTSGPPAERYLRVTDGVLYWPEAVTHTENKQGANASEERAKGHLVPILSREAAQEWASLPDAVKRPDFVHLAYASFTPKQAIELFPDAVRGAPKEAAEPFELVGTVKGSAFWPGEFKDYVQSSLAMSPDAILVIEYGATPLQKSSAMGLLAMGAVLGAVGFIWLRKRRSTGRRTAGARGGVRAGVEAGIDAAFANVQSEARK